MMPDKRAVRAPTQQLQNLQLSVMRFADEYVGRTGEVLNQFQASAERPEERLRTQSWKLQQATSAYTIASGPNPVSNALDMVVLASLSRLVLDDAWVGDAYGARAAPVQATYRALEGEAWQLLVGVLSDTQMTRLHEILTRWRNEHPNVRAVSYIHFRDFAKSVGAPRPGEERESGSLFSMLRIDPLAGLDPAVREIAQTRELAERSIYYMQRAPALIDMEAERLTDQFAVMPETKALLGDVSRVSLVGSASDRLVSTLPGVIAREREALIAQLKRMIEDESATLSSTATELRTTLQAATETANAVHGTLEALEHVSTQFASPAGTPVAKESGQPFDIRQYTEMLREATNTTRELDVLAQHADSALPALRATARDAAQGVDRILNHVFILLLGLVVAVAVAAVLAALTYHRLAARLEWHKGGSATPSNDNS
jgi:hypothetical protein